MVPRHGIVASCHVMQWLEGGMVLLVLRRDSSELNSIHICTLLLF